VLGLKNVVTTAVARHPLLRLYAAVADPEGPWPAHPAYPGGTVATPLAALLADGKLRSDLHQEDRWAEFLVRPLVTVFRVALEHTGAVLDTAPESVAIEVVPPHRVTGRVVLSGLNPPSSPAEIDRAARDLARCLDLITAALTPSGQPADGMRARVWRIAARELRFLAPATADMLRGDHPLAAHVHCVPEAQDRTLRGVLDEVEERTRRRRADLSLPRPAVMMDLDFVVLDPRDRTSHAARQVSAARPGAPDGILELAYPELLDLLPTDQPQAWRQFIKANGLSRAYPDVDFEAMRLDYCRAFHRPWARLAHDDLAAGVVRFIRDVEDRGGTVVFNTGRRERVRTPTEAALANGGLLGPRLLMMPDDRIRPVAELKAVHTAKVADLDIVAVFDDLADNREALARALPGARMVAVTLPGFVPGDEPSAGTATVSTFERLPRPLDGPVLSHAHSVGELHVGELATRPPLAGHGVHLSRSESLGVVERLISGALAAADETATRAKRQGDATPTALVYHVLTRKRFRRGARTAYSFDTAARDIGPYVERGEPIRVVLPAFPVKQADSGLKALGTLPDLAELALLVRLRELATAVAGVYPPGLRITLLTDGNHFRIRPHTVTEAYLHRLRDYLRLAGADGVLELRDVDEAAAEQLGLDAVRARGGLLAAHRSALAEAYRDLDVTRDPIGALNRSRVLDPAGPRPSGVTVAEIFRSLVHSVAVPPGGTANHDWASTLYADVYHLDGPVPPEVVEARRAILRAAWDAALHYVSVVRTDHDLGYDRMFWPRVRLTLSTPVAGRCGFAGLGGSAVPPWQGTAAVDQRGQVSTDFAIHLLDQAFAPVYSPLLGDGQPWFMAPITMTQPLDRPGTARLAPGVLERIRLRRR
jgi:hypothetical protein